VCKPLVMMRMRF